MQKGKRKMETKMKIYMALTIMIFVATMILAGYFDACAIM